MTSGRTDRTHIVPCLGYVFRERPRPGRLDPALFAEALERNKEALKAPPYNFTNPYQVLSAVQSTNQPFLLPDQTVLYPPEPHVPRKLVILGDTSDPSKITEMAQDASILVHEATNAYMPNGLLKKTGPHTCEAAIRPKAISRGHSTATMAGEFARAIGARRLVLNHFSARYVDRHIWQ